MPPAAISRSSTYFPKICGNIRAYQRSAFSPLLLSALLLPGVAACSDPAPGTNTLTILAHELERCPIPQRAPNDPSPFRLTLTALGDFGSNGFEVETDIGVGETNHALGFDPATRGVDAVATDLEQAFIGHAERRTASGIDVLLWPEGRACSLAGGVSGEYPGASSGHALGFSANAALALVAGEDADDQRSGSALTFDAERGTATSVTRERGALHVYRAFASVTEFGAGMLVAGGTNPFSTAAAVVDASGTAEVYDPARGGFEPELIELSFRRANHAAVALPTTGETLLIGGFAPNSTGSGALGQVITQLEAVSVTTRSSSISNLGKLEIGRVAPTAFLLSNGWIFVGGGYFVGNADSVVGEPVGRVEWFPPNASGDGHDYAELPQRKHRTFAPMPGGGVLSVASCNDDLPTKRTDCSCFTAAGKRCDNDADGAVWLDAWWIGADEIPRPVEFVPSIAFASCPVSERPLLAAGSDGAPWLVSSREDGSEACLWRFEAWPERDAEPGEDDGTDPTLHPRFVTTTLTLAPAPDPETPLLSLGPDAMLWVTERVSAPGDADALEGGLYGARLGHRGALTRDEFSLLSPDGAPFRPAHLVPDRDPSAPATSDSAARPLVSFTRGALTLRPAEPPLTLFAADTLYDGVAVTLEASPAEAADVTPSLDAALPRLVFASSTSGEVGVCAWLAPDSLGEEETLTLTAVRRGTQVTLGSAGGETSCDVPNGQVSLGVRAGGASTRLAAWSVERQ